MSRTPFDLSKIRGIAYDVDGVLSPQTIPLGPDGMPARMVNIRDGYAMQLAAKRGLKQAIITGGDSVAVAQRFNGLGIKDVFLKASMKRPVLEAWMQAEGLEPGEVAFVGDDIPDIPAMQAVGLPVCPRDAAPEVRNVALYISPVNGGYGVARDLLEQVLAAKGEWMSDIHAFGW